MLTAKASPALPTKTLITMPEGTFCHGDQIRLTHEYRLRAGVYQLFTQGSNYAAFSNSADPSGHGGNFQNIENLHNAIHALVGGSNGHMVWVLEANSSNI